MDTNKNRICFTAVFFLTATAFITSSSFAAAEDKQLVKFVQDTNKIDILIGGKLFTTYQYGSELTKPRLNLAELCSL